MKKLLMMLSTLLFSANIYSQVGVNTESPKATLHVEAKTIDGSLPEGFIAPRLTGDALFTAGSGTTPQYGTDQNGAIVYVTAAVSPGNDVGQTINVNAPGYYYFDGIVDQWKKVGDGNNIYNVDGTLAGSRTMNLDSHTMGFMSGRVGVGINPTHPSVLLHLESTTRGFLPPRMTKVQMDAITNPTLGLLIYCTDCFAGNTGCIMVNDSPDEANPMWGSLCSSNATAPNVLQIDCAAAVTSGAIYQGIPVSGVASTVPYTGGNGGIYPAANFSSTGVTGLIASLPSGVLNTGNGNLVFNITGTPSATGTASFDITVAGKSCTFTISVTTQAATVGSLTCGSAIFAPATLTQGISYSGTLTVPYTGGNGGAYSQVSFTNNGLTFTLPAGTLVNSNGNLVYNITGIPTASGAMSVPIAFGGKSCNVTTTVATQAATIGSLTCGSAIFAPATLTQGTAYSGTLTVPYTGGNGGVYSQVSFTNNGLTFTLPAGTLVNSNGNLVYNITGIPTASGAMSVPIAFGGKSCNVTTTVATGNTVVLPGNLQGWMKHNLGANTSLDPNVPVQGIHGNYYQWGRPTVVANASTSAGTIGGWNTSAAPDNSWQDATKTANDPCPAGFRIPTKQQFLNLFSSGNAVSILGTFQDSPTNFGSARVYESGANKLTLPSTGLRNNTDGLLISRGYEGRYWSSSKGYYDRGANLVFQDDSILIDEKERAYGMSIRCISE